MTGTRIALDAMGGDLAPRAVVEGALRASAATGDLRIAPERIVLVGDQAEIAPLLDAAGGNPGFVLEHASQVIGMGESPATALRAKPDSSIARCVRAVREGQAGAVVSMGNTGAVVGASTLGLGTLPGVRRPGIAVTLDLTGNPLTVLDMGANIAPKPQHLCDYGAMGAIYTQTCLGKANPRVALLNIGEEEGKGTELLKEARLLMKNAPFHFAGNIEGGNLFQGEVEVVVTDGFTGNVVLKLLEGFSGFLLELVLRELAAHGARWGGEVLSKIRRQIDYAEYGGALLLGVSGVVVIGHGRSDPAAVANAIALACRALDADVNSHIVEGLARAQNPAPRPTAS